MPLAAAVTEQMYLGDGVSTGPYVLSAEIEVATDLVVTVNGVVLSSYTVTGIGSDAGVSVTFDTPMPNGAEIVLARVAPYDRTRYDYQLGNFKPDTVDADVDRVVMQIQQLATALLRVPQLPRGKTSLNLQLTPEANKLIGWSADALSLVNLTPATITPAALVFSAIGQLLAIAATQADGRSAIGAMSQADVDASIAGQVLDRNRLINGAMEINQRVVASVALTTAGLGWVVDRWQARSLSAPSGTLTGSQVVVSSSPQAGDPRFFVRLARTAGTYAGSLVLEQVIERNECFDLAGNQVALSVKLRKGTAFTGTGVRLIVCSGQGIDEGSNSLAAGTWLGFAQNVAATVPAASISAAVFQTFSGVVTLPAGVSSMELAVRIEVQGFSGAGAGTDQMDIADVQLEIGAAASKFARRPFVEELNRCRRFYEKSYSYAVAPGTATQLGAVMHRAQGTGSLVDTLHSRYVVPKRTVVAPIWWSTVTGAQGQIRDTTAPADVAITGTQSNNDSWTGVPVVAATVAGRLYEAHWTVDASL